MYRSLADGQDDWNAEGNYSQDECEPLHRGDEALIVRQKWVAVDQPSGVVGIYISAVALLAIDGRFVTPTDHGE